MCLVGIDFIYAVRICCIDFIYTIFGKHSTSMASKYIDFFNDFQRFYRRFLLIFQYIRKKNAGLTVHFCSQLHPIFKASLLIGLTYCKTTLLKRFS